MSPSPEINPLNPLADDVDTRSAGETDYITTHDMQTIASRLGTLSLDEETVLKDYQQDAFEDIVDFYAKGGKECYVQLPTGTGKTVLFVELVNKYINSTPDGHDKPRVIVLVPTTDLADQTVGSIDETTGKRRGFKGFAPEIDARPHHSRLSSKVRDANAEEAEVLVTTYNTFRNLIANFKEADSKTTEEWQAERLGYLEKALVLEKDILRLRRESNNLLNSTFIRQEVQRARIDSRIVLRGNNRSEYLPEKDVYALEKISIIADDEEMPYAAKLSRIKRLIGKELMTPKVADTIKWMSDETKARRHRLKRAETNEKLINISENDLLPIEDIAKRENNLNDAEEFIVSFLWRNRAAKQPKIFDITNRKGRDAISSLREQANDAVSKRQGIKGRAKAIKRLMQLKDSVDRFGLVVCDEAHRVIGTETWQALRDYAASKDLAILGLTATDEYADRTLLDFFEDKAHELTKQEAIKREIVNPVSLFVKDTKMKFENVSIDASGDYDNSSIKSMRLNDERNQSGVDIARELSKFGYHGIISCIPGDEGQHAQEIAKMINSTIVTDPITGEQRNMRARYILGQTPRDLRKQYFAEFERGELDFLTYIDALREGWDSDRAKALINLRPTRSPLLATQRLGRIGRTYEGAPPSIVVDFFDGIEDDGEYKSDLPPVLASDVFKLDNLDQGYTVGKEEKLDNPVIARLQDLMTQKIESYHTRYSIIFEQALAVDVQGKVVGLNRTSSNEWQSYESIRQSYRGFLPKEILLDAMASSENHVRAIKGRRGASLIPLFNVQDVLNIHKEAPVVNPWKLYIDDDGFQWITPEGITTLLSKKYPNLMPDQVSDSIRYFETATESALTKKVGRVKYHFIDGSQAKLGFTLMYKLEEIMESFVPYVKDNPF